jgi:putative addiction module component (TIGR02574 family)
MSNPTRDLFDQVLNLPEDVRQQLVEEVLASFENPSPAEVERAWLTLAEQRLEEVRSGKVQTISAEEADARTEARLAELRRGR